MSRPLKFILFFGVVGGLILLNLVAWQRCDAKGGVYLMREGVCLRGEQVIR